MSFMRFDHSKIKWFQYSTLNDLQPFQKPLEPDGLEPVLRKTMQSGWKLLRMD